VVTFIQHALFVKEFLRMADDKVKGFAVLPVDSRGIIG
jgi:hypothetical protein